MPVKTAAGTKVFISAATTEATDTIAEYDALTPWTEVGLVETIGEYGDESAAVTFTSLGDSRVRKGKGARDAGNVTITVGNDPGDAGQAALIAAEGTNFVYAFKVVYPDRKTPAGTDSVEYFRGIVMSKRKAVGDVNAVIRRTFNVAIDSPITEKPAT
jgi:hypothetical protein